MSLSSKAIKQTVQATNSLLIASSIAAACVVSMTADAAEPETKLVQPASNISLQLNARPLGEALKEIAAKSGINFRLADGLQKEKVTANLTGKDWSETSQALLKGYNYAVEVGKNGVWETVTISGKNGDGKTVAASGSKFQQYSRRTAKELPVQLQNLNPGSVTPITLPLATLKGMKLGKKISLDLPSGATSFVHDNRVVHKNGDISWVGYQEQAGQPNRAMITMGKYGPMGHIVTPEGTYQLVTEDGQSYLVDVNASGLQPGSLLADQATANPDGGGGAGGGGNPTKPSAASNETTEAYQTATTIATTASTHVDPSKFSTIDVLVLYTKGLAQPETRINYLTDLTNQAFLDSKVHAKIRVVKLEAVNYAEKSDNSQALSDLTNGTGPFGRVRDSRERFGADLVTLIRPFHSTSQKLCGIAWINGSNGSALSKELGFSVVSDGTDQDGQMMYCGEHSLAHELGHNLGNVHDRPFTNDAGVYPYSYAWGVEGSFGTIMSYRRPSVLLFSTPLLTDACHGQACGYPEGNPNASDNSATINQTAPTVARFLPTVVTDDSMK